MSKSLTLANGDISAYGFMCGYGQRHNLTYDGRDYIQMDAQEGIRVQVHVRDLTEGEELHRDDNGVLMWWFSFPDLSSARRFYARCKSRIPRGNVTYDMLREWEQQYN